MNNATKVSRRENEVLHAIAFEKSIYDIAIDLHISPHTVISHRKNLKRKLKAKNAAGLIRRAFELGLLKTNHHAA